MHLHSLIDTFRDALGAPRSGHPICRVCGGPVTTRDRCMRLRAGGIVHCRCAGYGVRTVRLRGR